MGTVRNMETLIDNVAFPWPPSVNDFYGKRVVTPGGRKPFVSVYLTTKAKAYIKAVTETILVQGLNHKTTHRLRMTATFCAPTKRKYDISNYVKLLEDALEAANVYGNDNQIDEWILRRGDVRKPGFIFLTCEVIGVSIEAEQGDLLAKEPPF